MRFIKTIIAVILVLLPVVAVHASSNNWNDWYWRFDVGTAYSYVGDGMSTTGRFGVTPDGTDNIGGSPLDIKNDMPRVYAAVYHENGENYWEGDTGFYADYYRSPVSLISGSQKQWLFYIWATPAMAATDDIGLGLQFMNPEPVSEYVFSLKLVSKPMIVSEDPAVGRSWQLGITPFSLALPMYLTEDGRTGYLFELSATAVPEPSSLITLVAGLASTAGFVLKRKCA